jgi:hypothetical protein
MEIFGRHKALTDQAQSISRSVHRDIQHNDRVTWKSRVDEEVTGSDRLLAGRGPSIS